MKSDIEIAQEAKMKPITEIAASLGLADEDVIPYGRYKAKINHRLIHKASRQGKMILVTAISPTPAGEGKTTTSVGLADAMNALGKKTMLCLREPSLGPVFGVKGGAAGGGYAQVVPMEDINLHFTGDLHAIGTANNLLAAMIDNSIQQGNPLNIDPRRITWKRCMDMNDRQLRFIVDGLGGKVNGTPREDGFDITVASEVMAIFCLATSISDLKERLSKIVCAYTYEGKPVTAGDIGAAGAMTALLKDALDPNLVQTLENNPAIIHGGPFANIAHGCNSVMATKLSLSLADYVITEAGFGADLGAEKFLDIKCRMAGLKPDAVVIVATVRALKYNGGVPKAELNAENLEALEKGMPNLLKHVSNIKNVLCLIWENIKEGIYSKENIGSLFNYKNAIDGVIFLSSFPPPTIKGKAKKYCSGLRYLSISVKTSQLFWKNTTFAFPADFERVGNIVDNCNLLVETIIYSKSLFDESSSIIVGLKITSISFLAFPLKSEQII